MLTINSIASGVHKAARDYPVKKVELFGSYAQGKQTEKSDVDLLVEFESANISLLTLSALRLSIEDNLNTEVDLIHAPIPDNALIDIDQTVTVYER